MTKSDLWVGLGVGTVLGIALGDTKIGRQLSEVAAKSLCIAMVSQLRPCNHGVLSVNKGKVVTCLGCGTVLPKLPKGRIVK